MVVVATVGTRFEAELLAAKLGAMGILWEIRSRRLVETTYPIGSIEVLVPADDADDARELLEPEDAVEDDGGEPLVRRPLGLRLRALRIALGVAFLLPLAVYLVLWAQNLFDVVR